MSQGEWLLLLNPDMSVPPGFLDEVDRVARHLSAEDSRAGIIGFRLTHSDGSPQASSGPWPTFIRTLAGLCLPRRAEVPGVGCRESGPRSLGHGLLFADSPGLSCGPRRTRSALFPLLRRCRFMFAGLGTRLECLF